LLAKYLNQLPKYTFLIGISCTDAIRKLEATAKDTLLKNGVNIMDVKLLGNFVFCMQKGGPYQVVLNKTLGPSPKGDAAMRSIVINMGMANLIATGL
jgi:hypothetical protein